MNYLLCIAGVVQLARTFPCQGRGCGFESRRLLHYIKINFRINESDFGQIFCFFKINEYTYKDLYLVCIYYE